MELLLCVFKLTDVTTELVNPHKNACTSNMTQIRKQLQFFVLFTQKATIFRKKTGKVMQVS